MLPEDAFMRNAPRIVELYARLHWEVIVNATDSISLAHQRLLDALRPSISTEEFKLPGFVRISVATDCWTIIDQTHALLQVLRGLPKQHRKPVDTLVETYQDVISGLRNAMDHVHQRLRNLSNRKGGIHPVYGTLQFALPYDAQKQLYNVIVFHLGGFQFETQVGSIIDTYAPPPLSDVGNIKLEAFDILLNISSLYADAVTAINALDLEQRENVNRRLEQHAEKEGISLSDLLETTANSPIFVKATIPGTFTPR